MCHIPSANDSLPGSLLFLRALIDHAAPSLTAAIYSTYGQGLAIPRYTKWYPAAMWRTHLCMRICFRSGLTTQPINGTWDRLVQVTLPADPNFKKEVETELGEEDTAAIFDAVRFASAHLPLSEALIPLDPSTPTPNLGKMCALLPRVLPITNLGNMPGNLNLPIEGNYTPACIKG